MVRLTLAGFALQNYHFCMKSGEEMGGRRCTELTPTAKKKKDTLASASFFFYDSDYLTALQMFADLYSSINIVTLKLKMYILVIYVRRI